MAKAGTRETGEGEMNWRDAIAQMNAVQPAGVHSAPAYSVWSDGYGQITASDMRMSDKLDDLGQKLDRIIALLEILSEPEKLEKAK